MEMTLDEYKAKMFGNRAKPQYQERIVEKGPGDQWKDSVVFERSENEYIPSQRVSVILAVWYILLSCNYLLYSLECKD